MQPHCFNLKSALKIILLLLLFCALNAKAADRFDVLSYHDIEDAAVKDLSAGQTALNTQGLIDQFEWFKANGYHVISLQDLLDAKNGVKHLPEKAVLLSFDDGYASFYEKVFPLLKKYHYPAMVSLVGSWMEGRGIEVPPQKLLNWEQVKELSRSSLVEVASHSDDLHRGLIGNPQGNSQPAGVTRIYDPKTKLYETDAAYAKRIKAEIKKCSDVIYQHIGVRPRAIVWPYGESNKMLIDEAKKQGMTIAFGLRDGHNTLADLSDVKRTLITENPTLADFETIMRTMRVGDRPLHVAHVDLDYIYDPDPAVTEQHLSTLLDRIDRMGINAVYLQAFADPDGDGNAEELYFPNRHLPMRADLFNRVAWQLRVRTRARVYAWMPMLAFKVKKPDSWFVHEWRNGKAELGSHIYKRLSPFNTDAKRVIGEIYEDLAKYSNFIGILYHDDGILSDFEDVTPQGLAYAKHSGLPTGEKELRANSQILLKWAKIKTKALTDLTDELTSKVREYRPNVKSARNYYALPLLQPGSEEWYAQSIETGLKSYDYLAIEAMPFMEKAENPDAWLDEVVQKIAAYPDGLKKTVFELQAVDWNTKSDIPTEIIIKQIKRVQQLGGVNIGYYPDNLFHNHPSVNEMVEAFDLPWYP